MFYYQNIPKEQYQNYQNQNITITITLHHVDLIHRASLARRFTKPTSFTGEPPKPQ